MAPKDKSRSNKSGGNSDLASLKKEKIQAVVLADSYQVNFMPLTIDIPRCLMPLANTPLIEYTLEALASAGVGSVYVYCCAHADAVDQYIKKSRWTRKESPFTIETVKIPDSLSVGDALRDLDSKDIIKSDFLLVTGDLVGNVDLAKAVKAHKDTKSKDKNAIMTMVLTEANATHRTRSQNHPGIFILDEQTGRCLRYEEAHNKKCRGQISIDADLLKECSNISFRNDLIDCHVDICSVDVPALFQENFDYDRLRGDFVRGILTSDLLGKTMYTYILDDSYAARVESPHTYDAVSKDVISRYTYPICPDHNMIDGQHYSYKRGHIYKESSVVLSQSAIIGEATVIGSDTFVGSASTIKHSVIGRRCRIGENVVINGAYIWDDVTIEDGAVIEQSIVANGVIIKENAVIEPNSIISRDIVIGRNARVPSGCRLTVNGMEDADYDTSLAESIVGLDGHGYVFEDSDSDDDESKTSMDQNGLLYSMADLDLSDTSIESDHEGHGKSRKGSHHRTLSTASGTSGYSEDNDVEDFYREAVASTDRSIKENHTQDIALLELNTLRMTMNAPHEKLRSAVTHALIAHIARMVNTGTLDVKHAVEQLFNQWSIVLGRITHEEQDEADLLQDIQEECIKRPQGNKILFYAASTLYNDDVVKEENVYKWWNSEASTRTEELQEVRKLTERWIEWMQNAEEESDSD